MSWLEKLLPPKIQPTDPSERRTVPEGLWIKCPSCETVLYKTDLDQNLNVCPKCDHHHRIGARQRLDAFLDPEGRYEIGQEVMPVDPLKFKDSKKYPERLRDALEARLGAPASAAITWRPKSGVAVPDDAGEALIKLIEVLDDHDDVQNVYGNYELSDALVAKLSG